MPENQLKIIDAVKLDWAQVIEMFQREQNKAWRKESKEDLEKGVNYERAISK